MVWDTTFLKKLEERELKYLGKIAKNRKVVVQQKFRQETKIRIDELAKRLPVEKFEPVILSLEKPKTVWVATFTASTSRLFCRGDSRIALDMAVLRKSCEYAKLDTHGLDLRQ